MLDYGAPNSGVTKGPADPTMRGAPSEGDAFFLNLLFFTKNSPIERKMYHISANLASGRSEKIFGVQKAPGGVKYAIRGRQKSGGFLLMLKKLFYIRKSCFI